MTHGSFLTRSVESKAKMAEMTRQISNPGGARNSKNFVFSTVEKESGEDSEEAPRPQVRKGGVRRKQIAIESPVCQLGISE